MDFTLIPFAWHPERSLFVAIDAVPPGMQCGCVCPSCHARLVARQGQQRTWHFAHEPRADQQAIDDMCEFSWAVSVRLMARQVLGSLQTIRLPAPTFPLFTDGLRRRPPAPVLTLTAPDRLPLYQIQIDTALEDLPVDAVVDTEVGLWCFYFTHRHRPVPDGLAALAARGICAIAVDLEGYAKVLTTSAPPEGHRDALAAFLAEDTDHKTWVAHPALDEARAQALEERMRGQVWNLVPMAGPSRPRESRPTVERSSVPRRAPAAPPEMPVLPTAFACQICEHRFTAFGKHPACPHCATRFAAVPIYD
ncbi:competence protein CoiA family protein [Luteibacter sp. PPL554]